MKANLDNPPAILLTAASAAYGVRLHEKGGKEHSMPCHHHLETYLEDYIEVAALAGVPTTVCITSSAPRA